MNNGMNEGGAGRRVASPVVPGTIMLLSAVLSAFGTAKGNVLMGLLLMMASAAMLALLICMRASLICCILCPVAVVTGSVIITVMGGGLDSVIVTWGFRDEDFLRAHGAQHLAHNTDELYEML